MRAFILSIFIAGLSFVGNAQDWKTDLTEAKATAKQEKQNIVLVFSGSDWCAPCIKLEKEIWSSEAFKSYAKDNFVLLRADFPRKKQNQLPEEQKEKNNKLAEKYNSQGFFPLVVVLNPEGEVLGSTGYKKATPEEYIKILTAF